MGLGAGHSVVRRSWSVLVKTGKANGDQYLDASTGKAWWVSGPETTRAKVTHVFNEGYGGVALRDLHQDAPFDSGRSLLEVVDTAVTAYGKQHASPKELTSRRPILKKPLSLFQHGFKVSQVPGT